MWTAYPSALYISPAIELIYIGFDIEKRCAVDDVDIADLQDIALNLV